MSLRSSMQIFTKHFHLQLLKFITAVLLSISFSAVTATGKDIDASVNSEQLPTTLEIENGETIDEGDEAAAHEGEDGEEEAGKEEVDDSEQYSDYPKNFIIPRGTCDPRPPAMIFSE